MVNEKLKEIVVLYYSRKDVQEAIYKFCQDRETVPRYGEGFGKRPDSFQYPSDLIQQVKKGATSFHCSEELWHDPLKLSTDLSREQMNELRKGWDLLIDIDCKWFDYSKKAAKSVIKALEFHGIENIGVKYSGSKGWHIIIPWKAFPSEMKNLKTKDLFPEWPRVIADYLKEIARPILENEILESGSEHLKLKKMQGIKCETCNNLSDIMKETVYYCPSCRIEEIAKTKQTKDEKTAKNDKTKIKKCPQCRKEMVTKKEFEFYFCPRCKIDSRKNSENFTHNLSLDIFSILGLDLVLVSPRHLFRCPYSLHEKTALASVVIDKRELDNFEPKDADPLKVKIRQYYPEARENEGRELLIQALDWYKEKKPAEPKSEPGEAGERKYESVQVDKSSLVYSPTIRKILEGMDDGKKRALFILINFYRSLGFTKEETTQKITEWNSKNKKPLKEGYIKSQLEWTFRQKKMLPPNYDKPIYQDLGFNPEPDEEKAKNPVSYAVRKSRWQKK